MTFPARYDGWCHHCHTKIQVGDQIALDLENDATHAECLAADIGWPSRTVEHPVCGTCFLAHAGECW